MLAQHRFNSLLSNGNHQNINTVDRTSNQSASSHEKKRERQQKKKQHVNAKQTINLEHIIYIGGR